MVVRLQKVYIRKPHTKVDWADRRVRVWRSDRTGATRECTDGFKHFISVSPFTHKIPGRVVGDGGIVTNGKDGSVFLSVLTAVVAAKARISYEAYIW